VRKFGLHLRKGAVSLQQARSLVRSLQYCLSFVRGRDPLYYSVIDTPTTNAAIYHSSVSHAAISMAQRKKVKSQSGQVRMGRNIKIKDTKSSSCAFYGNLSKQV